MSETTPCRALPQINAAAPDAYPLARPSITTALPDDNRRFADALRTLLT